MNLSLGLGLGLVGEMVASCRMDKSCPLLHEVSKRESAPLQMFVAAGESSAAGLVGCGGQLQLVGWWAT